MWIHSRNKQFLIGCKMQILNVLTFGFLFFYIHFYITNFLNIIIKNLSTNLSVIIFKKTNNDPMKTIYCILFWEHWFSWSSETFYLLNNRMALRKARIFCNLHQSGNVVTWIVGATVRQARYLWRWALDF